MIKKMSQLKDADPMIEKKNELKKIRAGISDSSAEPSPCADICDSYCGETAKNDDKMYTSNKAYY